jgi:nucleotide-binding universal stress UspA family protein
MKIKPTKNLGKLMRETGERIESRVAAALVKAARKQCATQLKRILATTDFSLASLEGVRYAVWMAQRFSASVLLAHVFEPAPRFSGMEDVILAREDHEVVRLAAAQLNRLAVRESRKGLEMTSRVSKGKPFHEIARLARECETNLIVIATRGHTGLKHVWLGSTAERVVRHAPCPVLTVPALRPAARGTGVRPIRLKRIVVPIDFSETSVQALPYAVAFAEKFGAEIILLHVVELFEPLQDHEEGLGEMAEWDREDLVESCLTRLRQEVLAGRHVRTGVRHGVPFQEITRAATSLAADLIIMTTQGHTGLKHVFLGSTAERVVRHADCPVLVVRDEARIAGGKRPSKHRPRQLG